MALARIMIKAVSFRSDLGSIPLSKELGTCKFECRLLGTKVPHKLLDLNTKCVFLHKIVPNTNLKINRLNHDAYSEAHELKYVYLLN